MTPFEATALFLLLVNMVGNHSGRGDGRKREAMKKETQCETKGMGGGGGCKMD